MSMTPDERVTEIVRLADQIRTREVEDGDAELAVESIRTHAEDLASELDIAETRSDTNERERYEAEERADEAEAALVHDHDVPIWHEAKGRIMEGQDPKTVLAWVLTHVSGEEITL